MNYQLLFETFPNLVPYEQNSKNKYIFRGNDGVFEIAKAQITAHEKKLLSIFLEPLHEEFHMAGLWREFFHSKRTHQPEEIGKFQLFKIVFSKPYHLIHDFHEAFLSIAGSNGYLIPINETAYFIFFINQTEFLEMDEYIALLQDDFKTPFTLLTTPLENGSCLRERIELLQLVIHDEALFNTTAVLQLDSILQRKMLSSFQEKEGKDYCFLVLKEAMLESLLIETVTVYIEQMFNFSQTAKTLFIHRNTLQKRLERFEKLSNRSLKNHEDLYKIMTAFQYINMYKLST